MSGKHFDAMTEERVLWEIKTQKWSTYGDWLRDFVARQFVTEARLEHMIATSCGLPFVFAVSDAALYNELRQPLRGIIKHIPRCKRP